MVYGVPKKSLLFSVCIVVFIMQVSEFKTGFAIGYFNTPYNRRESFPEYSSNPIYQLRQKIKKSSLDKQRKRVAVTSRYQATKPRLNGVSHYVTKVPSLSLNTGTKSRATLSVKSSRKPIIESQKYVSSGDPIGVYYNGNLPHQENCTDEDENKKSKLKNVKANLTHLQDDDFMSKYESLSNQNKKESLGTSFEMSTKSEIELRPEKVSSEVVVANKTLTKLSLGSFIQPSITVAKPDDASNMSIMAFLLDQMTSFQLAMKNAMNSVVTRISQIETSINRPNQNSIVSPTSNPNLASEFTSSKDIDTTSAPNVLRVQNRELISEHEGTHNHFNKQKYKGKQEDVTSPYPYLNTDGNGERGNSFNPDGANRREEYNTSPYSIHNSDIIRKNDAHYLTRNRDEIIKDKTNSYVPFNSDKINQNTKEHFIGHGLATENKSKERYSDKVSQKDTFATHDSDRRKENNNDHVTHDSDRRKANNNGHGTHDSDRRKENNDGHVTHDSDEETQDNGNRYPTRNSGKLPQWHRDNHATRYPSRITENNKDVPHTSSAVIPQAKKDSQRPHTLNQNDKPYLNTRTFDAPIPPHKNRHADPMSHRNNDRFSNANNNKYNYHFHSIANKYQPGGRRPSPNKHPSSQHSSNRRHSNPTKHHSNAQETLPEDRTPAQLPSQPNPKPSDSIHYPDYYSSPTIPRQPSADNDPSTACADEDGIDCDFTDDDDDDDAEMRRLEHLTRKDNFQGRLFNSNAEDLLKEELQKIYLLEESLTQLTKDVALQADVDQLIDKFNGLESHCPYNIPSLQIGDRCFSLELTHLNFDDAQKFCFKRGGSLAQEPFDVSLWAQITKAFPNYTSREMWIGATSREGADGPFQFLQGGTVPDSDTRWQRGSPSSSTFTNKNCLAVDCTSALAFKDMNCAAKQHFICEFPVTSLTH